LAHGSIKHQAKHFFYAAGWKKFEPLWDYAIRTKRLAMMTPLLEGVLSNVTAVTSKPIASARGGLIPLDLDAVAPSFVTVHRRHEAQQAALPAVAE
jgi:hypothetical protein